MPLHRALMIREPADESGFSMRFVKLMHMGPEKYCRTQCIEKNKSLPVDIFG